MNQPRLTLDNSVFAGRLRQQWTQAVPAAVPSIRTSSDDQITAGSKTFEQSKPLPVAQTTLLMPKRNLALKFLPAVYVSFVTPEQQPPTLLEIAEVQVPPAKKSYKLRLTLRPQLKRAHILYGMAGLLFVVGLTVSLQGFHTNHLAQVAVTHLSDSANPKVVAATASGSTTSSQAPPSTTKPTLASITSYNVAPDEPRYIKITKLGVNARVLQVWLNSNGALGTPNNVYDTAWYGGSAKPGQQGVTLIDGHVSSWTTNGVFYGISKLSAGDSIQIVRGDGKELNYQVVKTQTYSADSVDMQAAMLPVHPGQSGLNLITCTGKVIPGTSEFNQRVIVFATLIN